MFDEEAVIVAEPASPTFNEKVDISSDRSSSTELSEEDFADLERIMILKGDHFKFLID